MKVNYIAQTISDSVAKALQFLLQTGLSQSAVREHYMQTCRNDNALVRDMSQ